MCWIESVLHSWLHVFQLLERFAKLIAQLHTTVSALLLPLPCQTLVLFYLVVNLSLLPLG